MQLNDVKKYQLVLGIVVFPIYTNHYSTDTNTGIGIGVSLMGMNECITVKI